MEYLSTGKRLKADMKPASQGEVQSVSSSATWTQEDAEEEPQASGASSVDNKGRGKPRE